ncbi:MAG TPA: DNA replication and repair protein RecF [Treponemataceae bacterium]|nr:DNA replication and repair protein RecF [Treponemataceae bacterium]
MPFLSLSLHNVRNLQNATIDLLSKEVYFVGENGQGKSNLLESLYLSAYGSSFRTRADAEIVTKGAQDYSIRSFFKDTLGLSNTVTVSFNENRKKITKNGKKVIDRKEMINTIPCVLFCHEDLDFAVGEPERRRFFIDQSLSMYDILYIDILRRYKKILKSRNLILKEKKYELLSVYNENLVKEGIEIQRKRMEMIYQFNRLFTKIYEEVSGIENVVISYDRSWRDMDYEEIIAFLDEKQDMDKKLCTTMSGPHRDRIRFVKDKQNFIPTASTGQKRLISIVLRISQAVYFTKITGKKPVLLMDDVLLEMDPEKRRRIMNLLPEYDQLFCTFLPGEPYEKYKHSGTRVYLIEKGSWNEQ